MFVYQQGKELLETVLKEEHVIAVLTQHKSSDVEGEHFELICKTLDDAKVLNMSDVPIVRTTNLRINAVRVKIEVKRALVKGVEERNPNILSQAIQDAMNIQNDLELPNYCINEIAAGTLIMNQLNIEKQEYQKIAKAMLNKEENYYQGKYSSEGASIANGSTVVDISIPPPSFKLVPLSSPRSPLSKTPKHVIF